MNNARTRKAVALALALALATAPAVTLEWDASPDKVAGYRLYGGTGYNAWNGASDLAEDLVFAVSTQ